MDDSLKKTVIHLCVLVAFAQTTIAAALISSHVLKAPPAYTPKPSNPDDNDHLTLEAVTDMLDKLEMEADMLYEELTILTSQATAAEKHLLPAVGLQPLSPQHGSTGHHDQIKQLQHRVKEALATQTEALSLASSTADALAKQINDYLNGPALGDIEIKQQADIEMLQTQLSEAQRNLEDQTDSALESLGSLAQRAGGAVQQAVDKVNSFRCEQASSTLKSEGQTTISFQMPFSQEPSITSTVTGFVVHLKQLGYTTPSRLGWDLYASSRSNTAFNASLVNLSQGSASLKTVYFNWLACLG